MQDCSKTQEEEFIKVDLAKEGRTARPIFINASLSAKAQDNIPWATKG